MFGTTTTRRLGIVAALVVALAAMSLGTATADAPVRSDVEFSLDDADCGGGLTYDLDATGFQIEQIKPDGTLSIFANWHGTVEGSNGKTLRLHHAFTESFALDGTYKAIGLPFGLWDDGSSILDRGLVVVGPGGVKVAGPHPVADIYGFDGHAATCALLAP